MTDARKSMQHVLRTSCECRQSDVRLTWQRCFHAGAHKVALFGVFDGHGGKQAATFASRQLLSRLQAALADGVAPACDPDSASAAAGEVAALREEAAAMGVLDTTLRACDGTDALAAALPQALFAAFAATQRDFFSHCQVCYRSRSTRLAPRIRGRCSG